MRKIILFIIPLATIILLFTAYSVRIAHYPGGAPAGYTGSPGDGQNCTACHGGNATTVSNWITSDVPPEGYAPGETYNITATATGSGRKGFEISPQNPAGNVLGTLMMGPGTELTGNGDYITHSTGVNTNPAIWNFQWTAPAAGTGNVTMYGAFAVSEPNTRLSTLVIPENITIGLPEKESAGAISVNPNPADKILKVNFSLNSEAVVKYSLVNSATGQKIMTGSEKFSGGNQVITLDCSGQAAGLYLLVLEYNNRQFDTKVLISH